MLEAWEVAAEGVAVGPMATVAPPRRAWGVVGAVVLPPAQGALEVRVQVQVREEAMEGLAVRLWLGLCPRWPEPR